MINLTFPKFDKLSPFTQALFSPYIETCQTFYQISQTKNIIETTQEQKVLITIAVIIRKAIINRSTTLNMLENLDDNDIIPITTSLNQIKKTYYDLIKQEITTLSKDISTIEKRFWDTAPKSFNNYPTLFILTNGEIRESLIITNRNKVLFFKSIPKSP